MVTACFTVYRLLYSCSLDCCKASQAVGVGGWVLKKISKLRAGAAGSWLVETSTETRLLLWGEGECNKVHGLDGSPTMSTNGVLIPDTFQAAARLVLFRTCRSV